MWQSNRRKLKALRIACCKVYSFFSFRRTGRKEFQFFASPQLFVFSDIHAIPIRGRWVVVELFGTLDQRGDGAITWVLLVGLGKYVEGGIP